MIFLSLFTFILFHNLFAIEDQKLTKEEEKNISQIKESSCLSIEELKKNASFSKLNIIELSIYMSLLKKASGMKLNDAEVKILILLNDEINN